MKEPSLRVGVDVGGTFTDVICHDPATGTVYVGKSPTSPDDPTSGVIRALEATLQGSSLAEVAALAHGTTVGLNAILQQQGATVGLLCTSGFRDVLEIRRGTHEDAFDLLWKPLPPLVPRRLRRPVRERIAGDGSVLLPLERADVESALKLFQDAGVESVAVSFINAWVNPAHEVETGEMLRELGFDGEITLSHELSREYREFERTSTAVLNAYIRPIVARYLVELEGALSASGCKADVTVMRSGGGTMTIREAEQRPFEAIFSGPVAGAEAAAHAARELGFATAIAVDVGGTSFDATLVVDGSVRVMNQGSVAGLPVQASWVDVRSIGAGGGSIAYIDAGGLLRVGPESAGALPGPAAYGRGGTKPTVTDAAAVLGMLGDGNLGGNVTLDRKLAADALKPLAEELGLSLDEIACGVLLISASAMANATREISVECGYDPREAALVAFGGAGPLFAVLLARELGCHQVVIPPIAGNFSAWGLLGTDIVQEAARTFIAPLDESALAEDVLFELLDELAARAGATRAGEPEAAADLRYVGQEHTLTVPLVGEGAKITWQAPELRERFRSTYSSTFFHALDHDVEVVAVRAARRTRSASRAWPPLATPPHVAGACHEIEAYSFALGKRVAFAGVDRASLRVGEELAGPAIVAEQTTTTYLDAGFTARVHTSGCLLLDPSGALR